MNAVELFNQDGRAAGVFYCAKCRVVHRTADEAEQCCQPRHCACGKEIERYSIGCDECWKSKRDREYAERIAKAVEVENWDGWVNAEFGPRDGWFESVEDLIEWAEGDDRKLPEFVFCGRDRGVRKADISDVTTLILDDMWEDADEDSLYGVAELEAAIEKFNEANTGIPVWEVDYTRKVRVADVVADKEVQ